jgi:hypothetical protein
MHVRYLMSGGVGPGSALLSQRTILSKTRRGKRERILLLILREGLSRGRAGTRPSRTVGGRDALPRVRTMYGRHMRKTSGRGGTRPSRAVGGGTRSRASASASSNGEGRPGGAPAWMLFRVSSAMNNSVAANELPGYVEER